MPVLKGLALAWAGAMLLAACGGGADSGSTSAISTPTPTSSQSASASSSPASVERTVGKTGWYAGFETTLDTVSGTPAEGGINVTLDLTFRNLGGTSASPCLCGYLLSGGQVTELSSFAPPTVAGQGTASAQATAFLPTAGSSSPGGTASPSDPAAEVNAVLDQTELVYGQTQDNQTRIPFAADGQVATFQPIDTALQGRLGKVVVVQPVKANVQPSYQSGEKGLYVIAVQFKASCTKGCAASGYNIDRSSFRLTPPTGPALRVADTSPWCCAAMYPGTVEQGPDTVVNFQVQGEPSGMYRFTFVDPAKSKAFSVDFTV